MSYHDKYDARGQAAYPQQYDHSAEAPYNPYDNSGPHQTYEQAGYGFQDTSHNGYRDEINVSGGALQEKERERSVFEDEGVPAKKPTGPKTSRAVRRWRYEHQGNLWNAGSRVRCCGRFFFCTILIFLFLLVSIVLSLALWVKPPNVIIGDIGIANSTNAIQLQNDGVAINLAVPISVNNPNYFSVKFNSIDASIYYPINNTDIGSGSIKNLDIKTDQETNFTLPFTLNYDLSKDPNFEILTDLVGHCGFTGQPASQIKVSYKIKLDIKIAFISIKPTISNDFNFDCPLTLSDVEGLLKAAGIDLSSLTNLAKLLF
jgi:LEA14-like dessication related protein